MKKLLIILFLLIDTIMVVICFDLYKEYSNDYDILLSKLNGNGYEEFMLVMENERDLIINNISDITGYEINDYENFKLVYNNLENDYNELVTKNNELVKKRDNLSKQNNNLRISYNAILEEEKKKKSFIISGFSSVNQYNLGYPTGCESAALTNLLKFYGVSVSMGDVVDVLPKGSLPYYENGIRYGGNPYLEFVGTPSSYSSYGVYEKPIIQVANHFKTGVIDGTGMSLGSVLNVVKENRPVIVWVSMNMAVPYISTSWIYKPTGEKISWMANEHALVVIGYNQSQVIVADSLNGGIRYYDKGVFESRYNTYGKRAVYY